MYRDDDFIQLSALQHFVFCPRQCALIHIEQVWSENLFTAEGRVMHENVHEESSGKRGDIRVERGVSLYSRQLGLSGKADVVEFYKIEDGKWTPFPVEYKRGKPKVDDCDKVQLCAQAMCLEEMLGVVVSCGAIFYGRTKRRMQVVFDKDLRDKTEQTVKTAHEFIAAGLTPKPERRKNCDLCSLSDLCMPETFEKSLSVEKYIKKALTQDEETA